MFDEVFKYYDNVDVAIMSAAVADYTPKVKATEKIKKNENELTIEGQKQRYPSNNGREENASVTSWLCS